MNHHRLMPQLTHDDILLSLANDVLMANVEVVTIKQYNEDIIFEHAYRYITNNHPTMLQDNERCHRQIEIVMEKMQKTHDSETQPFIERSGDKVIICTDVATLNQSNALDIVMECLKYLPESDGRALIPITHSSTIGSNRIDRNMWNVQH